MPKDSYVRGFYQNSKAWYTNIHNSEPTPEELDTISIGIYAKGGGTLGSFTIKWELLDGKWSPKLFIYDDSWKVFFEDFKDLHAVLSNLNDQDIQPDELAEELRNLDIVDLTPTSPTSKPLFKVSKRVKPV